MGLSCLECGDDAEPGRSRCRDCRLPDTRRKPSAHQRGYPAWWTRLSKRARELQPWCSECGHPGTERNPLTVDHTPAAWALVEAGKRLTLKHFEAGLLSVLCLKCNVDMGSARGPHAARTD